MTNSIPTINQSKAIFDDIYVRPDPRSYYQVLGELDYMIPDVAEPIIRQLLDARANLHRQKNVVIDVGCSYGINAAIQRFPVSFRYLQQRYAGREMMEMPSEELIKLDRAFYSSWPELRSTEFIGLDAAAAAIGYANRTGLHVNGVAADLEAGDLKAADAAIIAPANVVLSTGSIGYVTHRTYEKVLDALQVQPWVISFVLRMFPYEEFISAFAARGMVTEKLPGSTFVQRRFCNEEEFKRSLKTLESRGIDPTGCETDGLFRAELFVSRPKSDVEALPLESIVTVTSGRVKDLGVQYARPRYLAHSFA